MKVLKKLFYFIAIFGIFLILGSCRTKKAIVNREKAIEKERKELKKDSVSEAKNEIKTASFSLEKSQNFELELQSDKDSLGNSKKMTFQQIRSPTENTFIVEGGSSKLKIGSSNKQTTSQKDSLNIENTKASTSEKDTKDTEKSNFKKVNRQKSIGIRLGTIALWLLPIALIFIAWRLKLFKL